MPQISIPKEGIQISQTERKTVEIQIPNTKFIVSGNQKENKLWDVELQDPFTNYKSWIRKNTTTESFALFTNVVLKTPFPYQGKRAEHTTEVKKFIKTLIKKQNDPRNKRSNSIRNKSSKLQTNRKRRSKNEPNLSKII